MVAVMDMFQNQIRILWHCNSWEDDGQIIDISALVEKPEPANAPSTIGVVGRYIIEPGVFDQLADQNRGASNEVQLTDALARQIGKVPFKGLRFSGERFDCGSKVGFLQANIACAMSRDEYRRPTA